MAKKKSKKQLEDEAFEELKRKALEPFKPTLTKEDVIRHEERLREESMKNYKKLKDEISESEMASIKCRADFEQSWNG